VQTDPLKHRAAKLLIGATALAVLSPAYIAFALPDSAVYHRNSMVFTMQVIPYAVCAAIWLPLRDPGAPRIAYRLSMLLFVAACVLYLPSFVRPRSSGDMVGLYYIIVCVVSTVTIVGLSVIALVALAVRRRIARGPGAGA
jgi:hypothetical protein